MPVRRTVMGLLGVLLSALLMAGLATLLPAEGADTGNAAPHSGQIVSDDPSSFTPHVMDGAVYTMTQVGNLIVVGGSFTTVRNAGSSTDIPRRNLFAFNATTGQVSTTFAPNPSGRVYKVQPAADGQSVYIGGVFTSVTSGGSTISVSRLYKADVATGTRIAQFQPGSFNGEVRDISVTGNRLWVAGKFTHVQGQPQRALATLNATTGARDSYFTGVIAGSHQPGSTTSVLQIASNPTNDQLVAIGDFATVNGTNRHQFAVLDISGASYALENYYTTQFESGCNPVFLTYMSDVEYSPDGSFFAVGTSGGYGGYTPSMSGTTGCDGVFRFESNASGADVRPTWSAYTGGDTTWTVEVTDDVVYAGGHQRWQNNPTTGNTPGDGAVSRPGIAALSAVNGLPWTWNPTRTLGAGVRDMIANEDGLFVGSDTDTFAGETHRKIAFLPLATELPPRVPLTLPGDIFRVASGGSQLLRRSFDGTQVTSSSDAPNGTGWSTAVGAFMVNGRLYTGYSNGDITRRTFDGSDYGPAVDVDTADELVPMNAWHTSDLPDISTMFYHRGQIYFTRFGETSLHRRAFEPESDVVGQQRFSAGSVSGVSYSSMRGAFVADGKLYFATSTGTLNVADWNGHGAVSGTASVITSAGAGWSSRVMFLYQGSTIAPPPPQPPTASFTVGCALLTCSFDAAASDDPDGTITDYAWAFGDGQTDSGPGATTSHTYASGGSRTVTLTVTDDDGLTRTTTRVASPSETASPIEFLAAASTTGNRQNHTVTIPASVQAGDLLVLFFVANTTGPTYTGPAGWTQLEAVAGDGTVGRAYARVAAAGDGGNAVTVVSSGLAKDVTTVAAYRGADPGTPLTESDIQLQTSDTAAHVTPTVTAPDGEHWLVSHWADKSSLTTGWTLPPGVTQRSTMSGTSGGHISAVLVDSNAPVSSGQQGGLTATANAVGSTAVTFSLLVNPG